MGKKKRTTSLTHTPVSKAAPSTVPQETPAWFPPIPPAPHGGEFPQPARSIHGEGMPRPFGTAQGGSRTGDSLQHAAACLCGQWTNRGEVLPVRHLCYSRSSISTRHPRPTCSWVSRKQQFRLVQGRVFLLQCIRRFEVSLYRFHPRSGTSRTSCKTHRAIAPFQLL